MSKKSIEETNIEGLNSEFEYDDSESQLRKKIKLENQNLFEKIKEINEDIDISEHEVHNPANIRLAEHVFRLRLQKTP